MAIIYGSGEGDGASSAPDPLSMLIQIATLPFNMVNQVLSQTNAEIVAKSPLANNNKLRSFSAWGRVIPES